MASKIPTLEVNLIGRSYKLACPDDERESLIRAADYLNRKMVEIRDGGRIGNTERVAVMAALHVSFELLHPKTHEAIDRQALKGRIDAMHSVLDEALAPQEGLF